MTKEERKARKAEKERKRLEKILKKPNRPTAFIVLFAFAALFLGAFIISMITTFVYPNQIADSMKDQPAAVIGVVAVLIVFLALFVLLDLAFGVATAIFTGFGIWRLVVFLKRRKLKLEHAVTDASAIDQIIDLDLSKEEASKEEKNEENK